MTYLHALDPNNELKPIKANADQELIVDTGASYDEAGNLKIAGTFSSEPPVGGATEAKQDDQIDLLGGGLPAALTAGGNLKMSIEETDGPLDVTTAGFDAIGVDTLSVTDSSARVELAATGTTLLVRNEGTTTAYLALGDGTVTAATTGLPIDPLTVLTLARDPDTQTHLAAITASGTTTLTAIAGTGGVDPALPIGMAATGNVAITNEPTVILPHANLGPFGDLEVMELTPVCHLSFVTGTRSQLLTTSTANSATVDTNAGRLRLQSGTNSAGSAIAYSARPVSYRPGQGVVARFTALFTAGAADSIQIAGMGNSSDGYFFGYNGATFGISRRQGGTHTWVAQAAWNGDVCDGNGASGFDLDPSKGVPLMIKYPFLGYGNIRFYVQNPATSLWILVHTIRYANSSADLQIDNPCLSFYAQSINAGAVSNQTLLIGSVGVFIDGPRVFLGPQFSTDNSKASITTETNVLTLRSATTVNGATNRGLIRVRQISVFTDANSGNATFRLRKNTTLGGTPSFAAISGTTADAGVTLTSAQSVASRDTAGTTTTGGDVIWTVVVFNDSTGIIDLTSQDIWIAPGETLTISGTATASATLGAAINWSEDVQ